MIDASRLELRHLRYFAVVAAELHFGRAAARLALSQPSLSLQIRQLEEIAGARLFDRHSRRVVLTDAGRVLQDAGARILRDAEAALVNARRAGDGHSGTLRVAFGPTLMLSTLGAAVQRYRDLHPAVHVELRELPSTDQMNGVIGGDIDVGFVRDAGHDTRLHVEPFAREPLLIALPRTHRLAGTARLPLSALAHEAWVLFPRTIAPLLHEQVMRLCRDAGFTPDVKQESREVYTTVGLVGAGAGVTIVPATVQRMSWDGVVYRPIPRAFVQISMVRASGPVRPVVETFISAARKAASPQRAHK
jgi:DNA-binding transcriptional LysR family regulator